jgi:hypothetical protein
MTHSQSEQQKRRRRGILKAAAGAPVIFTLPAGAQVAAGSLTCIDKQNVLPIPEGALSTPDTWIRYRVERVTAQFTNPDATYDTAFLLDDIWYKVDGNKVSKITGTLQQNSSNPSSVSTPQYYFLLVDQSKYYSTTTDKSSYVYLGQAIATPVAGTSCWNSITPGTDNDINSNVLS